MQRAHRLCRPVRPAVHARAVPEPALTAVSVPGRAADAIELAGPRGTGRARLAAGLQERPPRIPAAHGERPRKPTAGLATGKMGTRGVPAWSGHPDAASSIL